MLDQISLIGCSTHRPCKPMTGDWLRGASILSTSSNFEPQPQRVFLFMLAHPDMNEDQVGHLTMIFQMEGVTESPPDKQDTPYMTIQDDRLSIITDRIPTPMPNTFPEPHYHGVFVSTNLSYNTRPRSVEGRDVELLTTELEGSHLSRVPQMDKTLEYQMSVQPPNSWSGWRDYADFPEITGSL